MHDWVLNMKLILFTQRKSKTNILFCFDFNSAVFRVVAYSFWEVPHNGFWKVLTFQRYIALQSSKK